MYSVSGPYVDQAGVALTSGGGTLVLASHDSVSTLPSIYTIITSNGLFSQIIGPGGQDLLDDTDGPILVYREF